MSERGKVSAVGAMRTAPNGYRYKKTEDGWRLLHHIVMEEKLGRRLDEGERVHFKKGTSKADFTADDLVLVQQGTVSIRRTLARLRSRQEDIEKEIQYWESKLSEASSSEA